MDAVKDFFVKCFEYLKANPTLAIILAAVALAIVVVVIVLIVTGCKRSKAKKKLAAAKRAEEEAKAAQLAQEEAEKQAEAERKAKEEKAAAEKKAVEEKLEAQRKAAEQEEAEKKAQEEAAAKAEAEKKAQEEKAKKDAERKAKAKAKAEAEQKAKEEAAKQAEEEKAVANAEPKKTLFEEMKDSEEEDDIWYDENETEKAARYSGKWQINRVLTDDYSSEEMYFFELHASNGEKLLSSEEYTTYTGAIRGIQTHKTNILKNNFKISLSKKGDYIFKLLSGKNMLLCMGENYPTRARCESAIESAKRFAKTAVIDENVQDYVIKVPLEDDTEVPPLPDGYNGKWVISSREDENGEKLYFFELFANNGEKLLSSEEYTTYVGAVNGIQTHKTNIEKGNFRVSLTKRGDYIYKLLNGNGQLLCLGEHYKTKRRCLNAVESVKRFAMKSPLLTDSEHIQ